MEPTHGIETLEPADLVGIDDHDRTPTPRRTRRIVEHDDHLVVKEATTSGRDDLRREAEVLEALRGPDVVSMVSLDDGPESTRLTLRDTGGPSLAAALVAPTATGRGVQDRRWSARVRLGPRPAVRRSRPAHEQGEDAALLACGRPSRPGGSGNGSPGPDRTAPDGRRPDGHRSSGPAPTDPRTDQDGAPRSQDCASPRRSGPTRPGQDPRSLRGKGAAPTRPVAPEGADPRHHDTSAPPPEARCGRCRVGGARGDGRGGPRELDVRRPTVRQHRVSRPVEQSNVRPSRANPLRDRRGRDVRRPAIPRRGLRRPRRRRGLGLRRHVHRRHHHLGLRRCAGVR